MKKYLSMLAALGLMVPSATSIMNFTKVTNQTNSHLKTLATTKTDLSTVITNTDLGWFQFKPNHQEIMMRVKSLNRSLETHEVYVDGTFIKAYANSKVYEGQVEIDYYMTQNLSDVIIEEFIGTFSEAPSNEIVLRALKDVNPLLDITEVYVDGMTVKAQPRSRKYRGQVNIKYYIYQDLVKVVKKTNLGTFKSHPNNDEIKAVLKRLNPDLDLDEVYVNGKTLIAFNGSDVYYGMVSFSYEISEVQDLISVIIEPNLGGFLKKPTNKQILAILAENNPELDIKEVYIKGNKVIAFPKSKKHKGEVEFKYNIIKNLADVITVTDLGIVDHELDEDEILELVKYLNPELDLDEVYVDENTIIVFPYSDKYFGEVEISYTIGDSRLDLSQVIMVTDLGMTDHELDEDEILELVKYLNPELDLDEVYVDENTIIAFPYSDKYYGEVEISYTIVRKVNLSEIITNTDLGMVDHELDEDEILVMVKHLNPQLDLDEVYVDENTIIAFPYSDKYFGEVEISYEVDRRVDLSEVITNTDLGTFDYDSDTLDLFKKLKELNPSLDEYEVDINFDVENKIVNIVAKKNSKKYKGSVQASYDVDLRIDLSKVILKTDLIFSEDPTPFSEMLLEVKRLNPELNLDEIDFVWTGKGEYFGLIPKIGSKIYKGRVNIYTNIDWRERLWMVVTNTNLGVFDHQPSDEEIIERAIKLNPKFNGGGVVVVGNTLKAKKNGYYYAGEVEISYTVDSRSTLDSVIVNTNLGNFEHEPRMDELWYLMLRANSQLNLTEVNISIEYLPSVGGNLGRKIHLQPKTESGLYKGPEHIIHYNVFEGLDKNWVSREIGSSDWRMRIGAVTARRILDHGRDYINIVFSGTPFVNQFGKTIPEWFVTQTVNWLVADGRMEWATKNDGIYIEFTEWTIRHME